MIYSKESIISCGIFVLLCTLSTCISKFSSSSDDEETSVLITEDSQRIKELEEEINKLRSQLLLNSNKESKISNDNQHTLALSTAAVTNSSSDLPFSPPNESNIKNSIPDTNKDVNLKSHTPSTPIRNPSSSLGEMKQQVPSPLKPVGATTPVRNQSTSLNASTPPTSAMKLKADGEREKFCQEVILNHIDPSIIAT